MVKKEHKDHHLQIPKVYDLIAESFDSKRKHPWKEVQEFIEEVAEDDLLLDLGCGNGRHSLLLLERGIATVGLDISFRILQTAMKKELSSKKDEIIALVNGDTRKLPFKGEIFDKVVMIAVIHHLNTPKERYQAIKELRRILKKDGKAIISCWLKTHPRFAKEDLREEVASGKKDVFVPWTMPNGEKIFRYYYLFDPEELEQMVTKAGLVLLKKTISNHNLFLVVERSLQGIVRQQGQHKGSRKYCK